MDKFHGLKIIWAMHDEVRNRIQETVSILQSKESDEKKVNGTIGKLFFGILGVAKKEDLILFPAASKVLSPQDWYDMHKQSLEYEFSFIEKTKEEIGRDVNNCHPPDSVHIVEKIVEGFRTGEKDSAKFWIELKGKMILIQYFALRDSKGIYRGTLEVSQDVTEIRELEGQRRLLDWD